MEYAAVLQAGARDRPGISDSGRPVRLGVTERRKAALLPGARGHPRPERWRTTRSLGAAEEGAGGSRGEAPFEPKP